MAHTQTVYQLQSPQAVARANCAGRGCGERKDCRRFATRISHPGLSKAEFEGHTPPGIWMSFDVERKALGTCESFVRQQFHRKGVAA